MKTLQFLQGQFTGFHFLFSFLNLTREFIILTSLGICSHILGPKYNADSLPLKTWIGSVRNVGVYLRLRCVLFLIWITSFIVSRDIPLTNDSQTTFMELINFIIQGTRVKHPDNRAIIKLSFKKRNIFQICNSIFFCHQLLFPKAFVTFNFLYCC